MKQNVICLLMASYLRSTTIGQILLVMSLLFLANLLNQRSRSASCACKLLQYNFSQLEPAAPSNVRLPHEAREPHRANPCHTPSERKGGQNDANTSDVSATVKMQDLLPPSSGYATSTVNLVAATNFP